MGKGAEKILHNFKLQRNLSDIVKEDDKAYWKFEE
jgi:hypothetical protein